MKAQPRVLLLYGVAGVLLVAAGVLLGTRLVTGEEQRSSSAATVRTAAPTVTATTSPASAINSTAMSATKPRLTRNVPMKPDGDAGPTTRPGDPDQSRQHNCTRTIVVNSVTSCPFADNVFYGYWKSGRTDKLIKAFSPTTGREYTVNCSASNRLVSCVSSPLSDAVYVSFPVAAVDVYTSRDAARYAAVHQTGASGEIVDLSADDDNVDASAPTDDQDGSSSFDDGCASRTHTPQGICTSDPVYKEMCSQLYDQWKREDDTAAIQRYGRLDCDQN
jgi:hypothetical protein